ncbi:MAG TPA: YbaB/EbfC family nucleoid-associated protein [Candidatus Binataceae bacterium]|nr:YbaB/EbfC family nucleoid-associated protein [Candidatus Binataceae bacterium]
MAQPDLSALLQQAHALQDKLKQMQDEAASKTVTAQSGGGMVRATVDGAMNVRRIEIDASLISAGDKSMLEDLIVVAVNEGIRQAQKLVAEEMGKIAGVSGFKIPGMGGD